MVVVVVGAGFLLRPWPESLARVGAPGKGPKLGCEHRAHGVPGLFGVET